MRLILTLPEWADRAVQLPAAGPVREAPWLQRHVLSLPLPLQGLILCSLLLIPMFVLVTIRAGRILPVAVIAYVVILLGGVYFYNRRHPFRGMSEAERAEMVVPYLSFALPTSALRDLRPGTRGAIAVVIGAILFRSILAYDDAGDLVGIIMTCSMFGVVVISLRRSPD